MAELGKQLLWIWDLWPAAAAVLACLAGWFRFGRRHYHRIVRSLHLSDDLHAHFGLETASHLAQHIHRHCADGTIREIRIMLLEQHVGAAVYVCEANGDCSYVNSELAELFGMDASSCSGSGWLAALEPDDRQRVYTMWHTAITSGIPYDAEYAIRNQRTGERMRVKTRAYPARMRDNKVGWYIGTIERVAE